MTNIITNYVLDNLLALLSILVGVAAATFAALAYFDQRGVRRNKFRIVVERGKNGSHITVTVTNIGASCFVDAISVVIEDADLTLDFKGSADRLEYGAYIHRYIDPMTIKEIPIYVNGRVIVTTSDGSKQFCESVPFGEMINLKETDRSFAEKTKPYFE